MYCDVCNEVIYDVSSELIVVRCLCGAVNQDIPTEDTFKTKIKTQ